MGSWLIDNGMITSMNAGIDSTSDDGLYMQFVDIKGHFDGNEAELGRIPGVQVRRISGGPMPWVSMEQIAEASDIGNTDETVLSGFLDEFKVGDNVGD